MLTCHNKFLDSKQEPLRLKLALEQFFIEDIPEQWKNDYGKYLRRRIRPAVEALIREENTEKLERFAQLGWISPKLLDSFIAAASEEGKTEAMVWLLRLKDSQYGYGKEEFPL